jgi:DNA-directed RNA polymerase I subunit RPA1
MGHIELCVPVYNPLLFPIMFKLMRCKCLNCHKFKMSAKKVERYRVKLLLLHAGMLVDAMNLEDVLQGKDGDFEEEAEDTRARIEKTLAHYEARANARLAKGAAPQVTCHARNVIQQTVTEFFSNMAKASNKCENCQAFSPKLRQEGYTKIFQSPMTGKARRANAALHMHLEAAVDSEERKSRRAAAGADDSDDSDGSAAEDEAELDESTQQDRFVHAEEALQQIRRLWAQEVGICGCLWRTEHAPTGWHRFFLHVLPVTPSRFRPPAKMGDLTFEHPQNVYLMKVLTLNEAIVRASGGLYKRPGSAAAIAAAGGGEAEDDAMGSSDEEARREHEKKEKSADYAHELSQRLTSWVELQASVNGLFDSSKADGKGSEMPAGIRQVLEKKEGLFRKHMMGKRVNYAARSVISPDPFLSPSEVGVPVRFAMALTYPQPVTPWNVEHMRKLVMNGADVHPGARYVEDERGRLLDLSRRTPEQREAIAKTLLTQQTHLAGSAMDALNGGGAELVKSKRVWRHLQDGDALMVNRQPTLHKPGMMAHVAKVQSWQMGRSNQQTIRMHYANCNTYNADFDGDEMNLHFPQDELARAEAYLVAKNDLQYLDSGGKPLRDLIQDSCGSGVMLTNRGTFLTKEQYCQVLYAALAGTGLPESVDIPILPPTILRPRPLWTGKQLISAILLHIAKCLKVPHISTDNKCRIPPNAFGDVTPKMGEHTLCLRDSELLQGVIDKNSIGSVEFGLVHAVFELHGGYAAGMVLYTFGRCFIEYMRVAGHTCGIADLTLTPAAEKERRALVQNATQHGIAAAAKFAEVTCPAVEEIELGADSQLAHTIRQSLALRLVRGRDPEQRAAMGLDSQMTAAMSDSSSKIIKACLPHGSERPFHKGNCFSRMVFTGAKGSNVNHSQISCGLMQQALEGRRVPVTVAGRSLPCFPPYDPNPRAGGFVADRFLSGVRPAEYYFHCMAGREGLVDTAVKTSRSGYLQRCLVKHLEELKVCYDRSVRDAEGNMYQTVYGEDGLDPGRGDYLSQLSFLARNHKALAHKHSLHTQFFENTGFSVKRAKTWAKLQKAAHKYAGGADAPLKKGMVLEARKKLASGGGWKTGGVQQGWFPAKVLEVVAKGKKGKAAVAKVEYLNRSDAAPTGVTAEVPASVALEGRALQNGSTTFGGTMPMLRRWIPDPLTADTVTLGGKELGLIGEDMQARLDEYVEKNPDGVVVVDGDDGDDVAKKSAGCVTAKALQLLVWVKYLRDMVEPGEAVGVMCAQSIGEPSTQMTLNTFHLAGHGGANVTLGIPRLREVIMTASKENKTPSMMLPFRAGVTKASAEVLARKLGRLSMSELMRSGRGGGIEVATTLQRGRGSKQQMAGGDWHHCYTVTVRFHNQKLIQETHSVKADEIANAAAAQLVPALLSQVNKDLKKSGESVGESIGVVRTAMIEGAQSGLKKSKGGKGGGGGGDGGDAEDDEAEQGTVRFGNKGEQAGYGEMDEEEAEMHKEQSRDKDEDVGGSGSGSGSDSGSGSGSGSEDSGDDEGGEKGHGADRGGKSVALGSKWQELSAPQSSQRNAAFVGVKARLAGKGKAGFVEVQISLAMHANVRKLLLVEAVQKVTDNVLIRSNAGIFRCFVQEVDSGTHGGKALWLQTEGINFQKAWALEADVDVHRIKANGVFQVLQTYGVEAARASVATQIKEVFAVYGIGVAPAHLMLLADYMTFDGSYRPLNRAGMESNGSPFLKMSFETTMGFLNSAAVQSHNDTLWSPSARIVMGQPIACGTGSFGLMQPVAF